MELVTKREKRKLTEQEITDLVSFIKPFRVNPLLPADDAAIAIADTQRHGFVRQLRNVLVYPQILRPFRDSLEIAYKRALIDAGKSVGALASTSIGEKNTQQSLSCVDWNERVLIIHKGGCIEDTIGRIIDDIIDNNKVVFRDPYVEQDPNILKPVGNGYIESRDVKDMWIPAVNENGKMAWRKIETVMRHPLYNRLLKVQLRSGRSVIGTSAKSFLTRRNNKIVATAGSDLKIGDRLPITIRAPSLEPEIFIYPDYPCQLTREYGFLIGNNLTGCYHFEKHVPNFAYVATNEFVIGLLDGYFSGELVIDQSDEMKAISSAIHLLHGISWLLTRLNIYSEIMSNNQGLYTLTISYKSISKFRQHIKLTDDYKQYHLDKLAELNHSFTYSPHDKIGGINMDLMPTEIHRDKLLKYSDEFKSLVDCDVLFDEIISIEDVDPSHDYVYDFTVEGTRTFGLLSGVQVNDSFHSAGQQKIALLVGVPRMEELVNVTRDIKTPSMEIWLDYPEEKLKNLSFVREKAFEWLQMREVIDFIVDYNIIRNREITENERKWYRMHSIFVGEHYENCEWSIRLEFNPKLLYQNRMTLSIVVKTIHDNYGDAHCVMSPDNIGIVDVYVDTDELGEVKKVIKSLKDNRRKSKKKHEEDDDADLRLLITDENKEYYFLRDLVLPSILHLQVGGIQGIKQCFFQEMNGLWYVTTNGSNLKAVLSLPVVNGYKTITNHLWDTFELLGSEASRQLLRREFEKVIGVGHRHIELLIDSMTSSGRPQPASSRGINIKDVGLLAKISFEHAWEHFFKGAMVAETDKIRGAASSIVAGNVPPTGSGYMGILDAKSELPIDEDAELYNHAVVMSSRSATSQGYNSLRTSQPVNIEIPGGITRRKITRPSALSKHVAPSPFTPSPGDAGRPRGRSRMMGIPLMPSLLDDTGKEELRRMKPVKSDLFKNNGRVTENEPEIY